eukprot:858297-Pelagomonas_calceolata.AAC.2
MSTVRASVAMALQGEPGATQAGDAMVTLSGPYAIQAGCVVKRCVRKACVPRLSCYPGWVHIPMCGMVLMPSRQGVCVTVLWYGVCYCVVADVCYCVVKRGCVMAGALLRQGAHSHVWLSRVWHVLERNNLIWQTKVITCIDTLQGKVRLCTWRRTAEGWWCGCKGPSRTRSCTYLVVLVCGRLRNSMVQAVSECAQQRGCSGAAAGS